MSEVNQLGNHFENIIGLKAGVFFLEKNIVFLNIASVNALVKRKVLQNKSPTKLGSWKTVCDDTSALAKPSNLEKEIKADARM